MRIQEVKGLRSDSQEELLRASARGDGWPWVPVPLIGRKGREIVIQAQRDCWVLNCVPRPNVMAVGSGAFGS